MSDFIAHCRKCKVSRRFEAPEVSRRGVLVGRAPFTRTAHNVTRDLSQAAPFTVAERSFPVEYHDRPGELWVGCPCGTRVAARKIRGRKTDHKCDAKCESATGHSCECACGGANHGRAHA